MKKKVLLFLLLGLFITSIRVYKLYDIPGEWFGDISNVHEYVEQILRGEWPFYFFQSPGPLYHYLIAPIAIIIRNEGYLKYKIASVLVSLAGIFSLYIFTKEVSDKKTAIISSLIMSFSFWYLIWSRIGNSQIVIPQLTALMSFFLVKFLKNQKFIYLFFGTAVSSLGLYAYPQTYIFPAVYLLSVLLLLGIKKKIKCNYKNIFFILVFQLLFSLPFFMIITKQIDNFGPSGYIGQKVFPLKNMSLIQLIKKTALNYEKTLLMLHVKGHDSFRVNVPNHPQLDRISGIMFFIGVLYFLSKRKITWLIYLIILLFILPIPSILPAIPDGEIPNNGRTIALTAIVYIFVGAGAVFSNNLINKVSKNKLLGSTVIAILVAYICYSNLHFYFFRYAPQLPDNNLGPSKIIAKYLDTYSNNYAIYFAECCWGGWGEPEPKAIMYQLKQKKKFILDNKIIEKCEDITSFPAVIFYGSEEGTTKFDITSCGKKYSNAQILSPDNLVVANIKVVE
ncbi:hypothetical protein A3D03_00095 [Candidatus Gottesmanbacteria bacterium RIFCSPHIGHO2_02_FULL_40_13]|uniref:Glycosyltransferase RgtA/B/C/D-like domain-containing protein n=1 Tax=Candidatus Gottesmanbacteria bacterium RIFCSPHIGHO2_02_FULL_40_13 TaxID=1798384 RepID=A0A1F6A7N5_9BACT|nr:MAG: hypothetical protein A3D03_00095 [Candidatus Gottesmanbacteria bacterium RIFCSPHIGHO2_02_FULL_40_13]